MVLSCHAPEGDLVEPVRNGTDATAALS